MSRDKNKGNRQRDRTAGDCKTIILQLQTGNSVWTIMIWEKQKKKKEFVEDSVKIKILNKRQARKTRALM